MKKIILLSLAFVGLSVTTPLSATATNLSEVNQMVQSAATPLLAQYRRNYNRQNYNRQYAVYYRNPRFGRWTLEGSHSNRNAATNAERRLQRRGYLTYTRESAYSANNYRYNYRFR